MKKKIIGMILGSLGGFLFIIVIVIQLTYGAVASFAEGVKNWAMNLFASDPAIDVSAMTEEEYNAWINDEENIYLGLKDGDIDVSAVQLLYLDEDTVTTIFTKIHEYNGLRDLERTVTYEYRTEDTSVMVDELEDFYEYVTPENISYTLGEIDADSEKKAPTGIEYKNTRSVTITRKGEEGCMSNDVFDLRWQPIYAMCALTALDLGGQWGEIKDVDMNVDMEDLDLNGYYLTDEQIEQIIDIFYYESAYLYDAVGDGTDTYKFKDFISKESAFRFASYSLGGIRTTQRVPADAVESIHNSYVNYHFTYEPLKDSEGNLRAYVCTDEYVETIPINFLMACRAVDPYFELDNYLDLLRELPACSDVCDELDFDKNGWDIKTQHFSAGKSIGIIYSPKNGDSDSGADSDPDDFIDWGGETIPIPYYEYITDMDHLTLPESSVVTINGKTFGVYNVSKYAFIDCTTSDGFTSPDQIKYILDNIKTYSSSPCEIFNSSSNRQKTAEVLYELQETENISVAFYLAIMRTEGAIKGRYGRDYYNYFNIKASSGSYVIPDSDNFRDYKSEFSGENGPWDALKMEIRSVQNGYPARGQTSFFKYSWNGYDGESWGSLYHCYCPPYNDYSMPWGAGSWYIGRNSGNVVSVSSGNGWVNNNAAFIQAIYQAASSYTPADGEAVWSRGDLEYVVASPDTMGAALYNWWSNIYGGDSE